MIEQYPLHWPTGYKRNNNPKLATFKTSLSKAANGIADELRMFGAKDIIISSNLQYRSDGIPYARQTKLDDTGVSVYFTYNKQQRAVCCDKWIHVEDNMHAIELTIKAMRGMDRWGVSEIMDRMFTGFTALPENTESYWTILGITQNNISVDELKKVYRELVKKYHPDNQVTGSHEQFVKIQNAYNKVLQIIQ